MSVQRRKNRDCRDLQYRLVLYSSFAGIGLFNEHIEIDMSHSPHLNGFHHPTGVETYVTIFDRKVDSSSTENPALGML